MTLVDVFIAIEVISLILAMGSVPSVLLERRTRPTSAIIWLLAFLFVPYIGVVLWWSIGRLYMLRRRRRRRRSKTEVVGRLANLRSDFERGMATGPEPAGGAMTARHQARMRIFSESDRLFASQRDNHLRLLVNASTAYPAFLEAIDSATDHIHFLFYIYQDDETGRRFRDALVRAAERGVEVRILVDAVGGAPVAGEFMEPLKAAGGHFETFLPLRFLARRLTLNFRNHRKLLIVDGLVAFTGGINIGDEYLDHWHDLAVRVAGPAVDQFQEVFAEDWFFATKYSLASQRYFRWANAATGADDSPADDLDATSDPGVTARCRVVASGPDSEKNSTFDIFFLACTTAARRIWIMTPYFIPDQAMQIALTSAALRGVDVRLLVPQLSDVPFVQIACRSYYRELLEAGVQIFEFEPEFLHAKMLVFDDDWAMLGSANVDIRSFRLNFEAGLFAEGEAFTAELAALFTFDQARSVHVTLDAVKALSWFTQVRQAAAHLFSPLM